MRNLGKEKQNAVMRLEAAQVDAEPLDALPDLVLALMERWRARVANMESLATDQEVPLRDIEAARR